MKATDLIISEIEKLFANDSSGHDLWHSLRVHKVALKIAETEHCNKQVVAIAALLHDVDDPKLFATDNYQNARKIMDAACVDKQMQQQVLKIISQVSFRGNNTQVPDTIEGKIVQDADRLDAMGAIGIARAFAYGGSKGRKMHDPNMKPLVNLSQEEYLYNNGTSVNHFYEKLFLLKDMMNTQYAQKIALARDTYMREYLKEFLHEWEEI